MSESKKNFFISYNKADRAWAEWIAWHLEEAGYSIVIQAWDFRPGSNFVLEMQQAASEAERTIAVISQDYLDALYTQPEWAAAFVQDPTGEKGTLLPVRVRECEIKGLLKPMIYIDLFGSVEEEAKKALLAGVKRGRGKPTEAPGFPGKRSAIQKPRFPGSTPSIWNIPINRNPNFTGREDLLSDIREALQSGKPAALTQAIHGLGGVGKTQLAAEYAYRHAGNYDVVWWIRSEEPATLASDYASLATELELPEKGATEQRVTVQAVKDWLRQNRDWLLVFDNAPDADSVRGYIPSGSAGHILITSRYPNWRGLAQPLSVKVMQPDEAVEFLINRTGDKDKAAARLLADSLGYLPLALEQAAAYIETTQHTFSQYLVLYQTYQMKLLQRGRPSTGYTDTIATTWNLSLQQVENESPVAVELMKLCAFLASDEIPLQLINEGAKGADHLPQTLATRVTDPLELDEILASLRQYSLIELRTEAFSIHRLVQAVIREQMSEETIKTWVEGAVCIVASLFPSESDDVRNWQICSRLLPHALAALSFAEAIQSTPPDAGHLFNHLGLYFLELADHAKAKMLLERAVAFTEAVRGPTHPYVAICLGNLGTALESLGNFEAAKRVCEQALAIDEAEFGSEHPKIARHFNNLGNVMQSSGNFPEAKAYHERALAIAERAFNHNDSRIAIIATNLGCALESLGDNLVAKVYHERALAITEVAFNYNHPNVALASNNLGCVLEALGDLAGAKAQFERALKIFQEFLDNNHPYTVKARGNLEWVINKMAEKDSNSG